MKGEGDADSYHVPVLVEEVMTYLTQGGDGLYLDGTLGGGGHAFALLSACPGCCLLGIDRDPEALARAQIRLAPFEARVRLLLGSFLDAVDDPQVRGEGLAGALLDLGVSSHQLDHDRRGFSMRPGLSLDMRMGQDGATAADYLASASEAALLQDLRSGDAPRPRALARSIVARRGRRPLAVSDDLVGVLESVLGRPATHSEKARVFQAVRIAVNEELAVLEEALPALRDALNPGGVLVVLSYHSGEDASVKRMFHTWSDPGRGIPPKVPLRQHEMSALGETLTRKPVLAGPAEVAANPRSRPARLRAWRKAA
ncbi:MAG: 16S rRNA (cytosine(1402)-N(4))-methyltransferase RsmH [Gemmatimonadota bacterium]|nr:16S rRNA (cytosine(1402)-N(4))-methyltransferase RsmH [Gemmatimonadota bacterium]